MPFTVNKTIIAKVVNDTLVGLQDDPSQETRDLIDTMSDALGESLSDWFATLVVVVDQDPTTKLINSVTIKDP